MKYLTILLICSFLNQKSNMICADHSVSIDYLQDQIKNLEEFRHIIIVPVTHVNDYQYSHVTEFLDDGYYFKGLAILFITTSRIYLIKEYEQYYINSQSLFIDEEEQYYQNMCFSAHPMYVELNENTEIIKITELTNDQVYPIKSSLLRGLKRVNIRQ